MLPRHWQPGLKLKVEWEIDPHPEIAGKFPGFQDREKYLAWEKVVKANFKQHSAIVDLPPYETESLCSLKVHFLPCNQIKVTTACMAYGQPGYPIKEPQVMKEPAVCPK